MILEGIRLCEQQHEHEPLCRVACDICEVLYPPRTLHEGFCAGCWEEPRRSRQESGV